MLFYQPEMDCGVGSNGDELVRRIRIPSNLAHNDKLQVMTRRAGLNETCVDTRESIKHAQWMGEETVWNSVLDHVKRRLRGKGSRRPCLKCKR